MEKKFLFKYILLLVINILNNEVRSWTVKCDYKGACYAGISDNTSVYIIPGYMPIIPDKNILPIKNITNFTTQVDGINQKKQGISLKGYLIGSNKFECTGGLSECSRSCCKEGICQDPANFCTYNRRQINLVLIIVGSIFVLFLIIYWGMFFAFGVAFNAKPKLTKQENIYVRFSAAKIENAENMVETQKENLVINNDIHTHHKIKSYKSEEASSSATKRDLMSKNKKEEQYYPNNENNYNNIPVTVHENNNENKKEQPIEHNISIHNENLEEKEARKKLSNSVFKRNSSNKNKDTYNRVNNNSENMQKSPEKKHEEDTFEEKILVADSNKLHKEETNKTNIAINIKGTPTNATGKLTNPKSNQNYENVADDDIDNVKMNVINYDNSGKNFFENNPGKEELSRNQDKNAKQKDSKEASPNKDEKNKKSGNFLEWMFG